jgi:hypothetical protein
MHESKTSRAEEKRTVHVYITREVSASKPPTCRLSLSLSLAVPRFGICSCCVHAGKETSRRPTVRRMAFGVVHLKYCAARFAAYVKQPCVALDLLDQICEHFICTNRKEIVVSSLIHTPLPLISVVLMLSLSLAEHSTKGHSHSRARSCPSS